MRKSFGVFGSVLFLFISLSVFAQPGSNIIITKDTISKAGTSVPPSAIGEPVGSVKLYEPRWVEATANTPAHGVVEGSIMPVDPNGWPINFRVLLPASWSQRGMQQGGGGMNGSLGVGGMGGGSALSKGFAIYGSDGGHQADQAGGESQQDQFPADRKVIQIDTPFARHRITPAVARFRAGWR